VIGPIIEPDRVTFRFLDAGGGIESVTLVQEVAEPRAGPSLSLRSGIWEGVFVRPPVDRFEYRFDIGHADGGHEVVLDPGNDLRAPGAFGDRSVIEFPGYEPPAWLRADPPAGEVHEIDVPSEILGDVQPTICWSATGTDPTSPLPLLVVLDGVEFARFSGLLHMLDSQVASGRLPPMRAALCQPTRRDEHYTASPEFAEYLARELTPAIEEHWAIAPERRLRAGLGASLGGLALLHAHRSPASPFGALFLQSSSFFQHGFLPGSAHIDRIEQFVDEALGASSWADPIPIAMTCGTVEQNLENNRECAAALVSQGYPAALHVVRDAHNWIAWRDAWFPHLIDLLGKAWS
jgi:enterochelin esterase-like enzyme